MLITALVLAALFAFGLAWMIAMPGRSHADELPRPDELETALAARLASHVEALAGAMFVPPVEPVHAALEAHRLRGFEAVTPPVRGNVADGAATAGLLQFPDDGHFAVFNNEVAELQAFGFLESLVADGIATIPAAP